MTESIETPRRLSRAESRRQTRERLLVAAGDVFRRHGYAGASLEAVAEAAGYTKGAVYSNFETKADLFIALLDRFVEAEGELQGRQFETSTVADYVDGLDAIFKRQVADDPTWLLLQMEFWLAAGRDPAIRDRLVTAGRELQRRNGEGIDAALADEGIVTPFTGEELSTLLNALVSGLALEYELDPTSFDPRLLVRAARRLVGLPDPGT